MRWWQSRNWKTRMAYIALLISVLAVIYSGLKSNESDRNNLILSVFVELSGAFLTFILIEKLIVAPERHREEQRNAVLKLRLATTTEHRNHIVKWMAKQNLLQGAQMEWIVLNEVDFSGCNLEGADLGGCELRKANFSGTQLSRVSFGSAHLEGANFENANMTDADLHSVHLTESGGEFQGSGCILPNGKSWERGFDMGVFHNGHRLDLWRSENPASPAYRGKVTD